MNIESDSPQVRFPPPFYVLIHAAITFGLNQRFPFPFSSQKNLAAIGITLIVMAFTIIFQSSRLFKRNGTRVEPWRSTSRVVSNGPYKYSRNPIYLSGLTICFGTSLWINSLWGIVLIVPVWWALRYLVISKEEAYLRGKFGEQYENYCSQVRRWI